MAGAAAAVAAARRRRGARPVGRRRRPTSARSGARVSLVMCPAQTRSQSAATSVSRSSVAPTASDELPEEEGAAAGQRVEHAPRAAGCDRGSASASGRVSVRGVGQVQRHPAVASRAASRARAQTHLAARRTARRAARGSSRRRGPAAPATRAPRPAPALPAAARPPAARPSAPRSRPPTCCQRGQERGQRLGRHRLDLLAQGGQRAAAKRAQHLGVAPLRCRPRRAGTRRRPPGRSPTSRAQRLLDDGAAEPEPAGDVGGR